MATNSRIAINISTAGDTIIAPGIAGQPISVTAIVLSLATEATVEFKSGSTSLSGPQVMLALILDEQEDPWYVTTNGEPFVITLGASVQCGGTVWVKYGQ